MKQFKCRISSAAYFSLHPESSRNPAQTPHNPSNPLAQLNRNLRENPPQATHQRPRQPTQSQRHRRQAGVAFAAADFAKGGSPPPAMRPRTRAGSLATISPSLSRCRTSKSKPPRCSRKLSNPASSIFAAYNALARSKKPPRWRPIDEWIKDWPAVLERQAQRTARTHREALGPGMKLLATTITV